MNAFLAGYGYAALFPLALLEGPIVTVLAGFMAARGVLDVAAVYLIVVVADLAGDLICYGVGRRLGAGLARRGVGPETGWMAGLRLKAETLAPRLRENAGAVLLFGKLTHSAGFAVLLGAGAAKVRMRRFLGYNLLGTLPKSAVLVAIGYWFGDLYAQLRPDLQIASVGMFVIAGGALLIVGHRLTRNCEPPVP